MPRDVRAKLFRYAFALATTVALGSGFLLGRVSAELQSLRTDGSWWAKLSDHDKIFVLQGMADGFQVGWSHGVVAEGTRVVDRAKALSVPKLSQTVSSIVYKNKIPIGLNHRRPAFSKSYGTYVSLIDDYYQGHEKDKTGPVADVLACLIDDPMKYCRAFLQ